MYGEVWGGVAGGKRSKSPKVSVLNISLKFNKDGKKTNHLHCFGPKIKLVPIELSTIQTNVRTMLENKIVEKACY